VNAKKSGLTVIEILVVVSIIALLAGMLLPAVHTVQKMAKETKQRAQLTAIELGLATFKNDYGDYPPSDWTDPRVPGAAKDYCGAQKLAEALLGWDLLGFHPDSAWRGDGLDRTGGPTTYDPLKVNPPNVTLDKRKGRYLELDMANAFRLGDSRPGAMDGLFVTTQPLTPYTHVLCDVFTVNERKILLGSGKPVSPGSPILYYRANPAKKTIDPTLLPEDNIYNARDNWPLLSLRRLADTGRLVVNPLANVHPLENFNNFYEYIRDPRVQARAWPYRPDSYILISAGADGLYGTNDDIRNFGQ